MTSESQVLECRGVSRELPAPEKISLLDNISFSVARAEVVAVLGPSGAGKSTLLRLLNRLDEPTSGTILLTGDDYRTLSPQTLRRRVGMIMQRAFLFPGTVAENVRFGPLQQGRTMADAEVASLLEQVGLEGYAERDVNSPEVLLLDEPTSALDEMAKQGVETLLESLIRKRGLTCVWVTHDAAQAGRMADSVLLLERGKMAAFGSAAEVLRSREVALQIQSGEVSNG
jgi:putative ABC transport system ATP-binding protein